MQKLADPELSFCVARNVPIGIVCVSYNGRLSRLFLWDLNTDSFTPGQFLKGRGRVNSMSPDGKYITYYVVAFHRRAQAWQAVSKPPYFTALAFFPTVSHSTSDCLFTSNGELFVSTLRLEHSWVNGFENIQNRVDEGCPFNIRTSHPPKDIDVDDETKPWTKRKFIARLDSLVELEIDSQEELKVLATFPKEKLVPIETPEWAKIW